MRDMRILHFINNIDLSWHKMLMDTLNAQERRGHETWVVFPPGGVNFKRINALRPRCVPLPVRSSKFDYFAAWKLAGILREKKIDILHTHLTSSALLGSAAAVWAGVPCVASVLKMTKKRRYMKCDALLPCSDAVRDSLLEQGVPPEMMRRVYTGIDLSRYDDSAPGGDDARAEFGFAPGDAVIGSVARLAPMKGHRTLIDAFALVSREQPSARLLIVGDGELRPGLQQQAAELGIAAKTVFAGVREDLPRILRALDISVLASIEKEGLPVILVESALMGVPSVMTDVAGIREVIRHGETGLLAPPGDASALAAALLDALRDTSAARSRAASAREFVRREFDVNNTAAQMDEVYLAVSSARGKAAAR